MNTEIKETSDSSTFTVEFNIGAPIRFSYKGKHWPKTTQCIIKLNGLIVGFGEAVKHENDSDNAQYGRVYAAKKAFKNASIWPEMRTKLWKQILRQ